MTFEGARSAFNACPNKITAERYLTAMLEWLDNKEPLDPFPVDDLADMVLDLQAWLRRR